MPKVKPQDPEFLVMPPDAQARVRAYLIARWTAPVPVQIVDADK